MIDLSPEAIDIRLRSAACLAQPLLTLQPADHARHKAGVDLSPEAIDRRLREVSELRAVCLELGRLRDR